MDNDEAPVSEVSWQLRTLGSRQGKGNIGPPTECGRNGDWDDGQRVSLLWDVGWCLEQGCECSQAPSALLSAQLDLVAYWGVKTLKL